MKRLSKRNEAHAVRIWGVAKPLGWDITTAEIADELGLTASTVRKVVKAKGWNLPRGDENSGRFSGGPRSIDRLIR